MCFTPATYTTHWATLWVKKNHLKSNFKQNKSSVFIPPALPQAGCCFPDGDAFLYVDCSPCLAAAACMRCLKVSVAFAPRVLKIWGDTENHVVAGPCPCDRPSNLFLLLIFFSLSFLSLPSYLLVHNTCWEMLAWSQQEEGAAESCLADFLFGELSASFAGTMNKVLFLAFKRQTRVDGIAGLCSTDFPTIPALWKGNTDRSWVLLIWDREPKFSHPTARQVLRATQTASVSCTTNK